MTERWFRWYDGTMRDGKMMLVAKECDEAVATIIGIWASLLEDAATNNPRGIATRGIKYHSMWLGIADHIIGTAWNALERAGAVRIDGEHIIILNWDKRQYETDGKDPTSKARKDKWKQKHKGNGTERNAAERSGTPESESESESESDKDISSLRSDGWPIDYKESFWARYPRKIGKGAVFRKLEVIRKKGEIPFDRLLSAISKIDTSRPEFIPYPMSWLNQGRYLDSVETAVVVDQAEFERLKAKYDEKLARQG